LAETSIDVTYPATRALVLFGCSHVFDVDLVLLTVEPFAVVEWIRAAAMAIRNGSFAGMGSIDARGIFLER
jgi:hypothetical protein